MVPRVPRSGSFTSPNTGEVAIELLPSEARVYGSEELGLLWRDATEPIPEAVAVDFALSPDAPVFPNRAGKPLSRSGVEHQLRVACRKASDCHPSLAKRRISPHTLRHTTAMHLLQSGVDITVIALWLGHEDTATTHQYVEADLAMKEAALRCVDDPAPRPLRFKATDRLLDFLEAL